MRANGRYPTILKWSATIGALLLTVGTAGCSNPNPLDPEVELLAARGRSGQANEIRFTGTVDMVWPGGKGMNAPDDDRYAQASLTAFPGVPPGSPGPGNFAYRVIAADGTLHREIKVKLYFVDIDTELAEVRFMGTVISDTKPCGGSGHGSDGCTDDDGGCSHDDGTDHDDGGCSHDDGTDHDDGGCSHDDGTDHEDGGCSHDDGSTGGHGEPGGSGGSGSHPNGSDCRIGQVVLGWAKDVATPGRKGDRISWKWFYPDAPKVLEIDAAIAAGTETTWPCKLCEKEINGGNLKLQSD
ncbi:MAG: hypothetical protein WBO43_13485 [Gemmatimonadota bacterium]